MSHDPRAEFASVEATHNLWQFFVAQANLFEQAYKRAYTPTEERWGVILPLAYSALDTCGSIASLAQQGKMRDCFVLSRTAFETLVNICFILAKGDDAVKRARQHALQKAYRDLARESTINGGTMSVKYQGQYTPNADMQAALDEFTTKKGREITSWTPETTAEEIAAIDAKFGQSIGRVFHFALMAIYRHSSEIAHGTYFGALFSLGMTSPDGPPETEEKLAKRQRENMCMVMQMLGMSLGATVEAFGTELPLQEIVAASQALTKELSKEAWVKP